MDTFRFTGAAKLNDVAQSSFTKSIVKLEEKLGGQSVFRHGKNTRLTAFDREVLIEFTKISQVEEVIGTLAEETVFGNKQKLNFGVSTAFFSQIISEFINLILSSIPELEFNLRPIQRLKSIKSLLSCDFDGCFI